jgi:hypothetical protein
MKSFRYDTTGKWLKGNIHLHSVASDGGKTFMELARLYASAGYDFLFRTDHWVTSDATSDQETYPLLWLDGVEINGCDHTDGNFHVVCLGRLTEISREAGFVAALQAARSQGALTILAHPHWCGNTLDDVARWEFDGIEIYNHVCHWLNGKSNALVHWEAALKNDPNTLAFSVDDAHLRPEHPGWNGGWIMVNADECSAQQVMKAIRAGNFYSTCGPELHSITFDGHALNLSTSPVQFIRIVGPAFRGIRMGSFDGQTLTGASIEIPEDWDFAYAEVEDQSGKRAWTNTLFVAD